LAPLLWRNVILFSVTIDILIINLNEKKSFKIKVSKNSIPIHLTFSLCIVHLSPIETLISPTSISLSRSTPLKALLSPSLSPSHLWPHRSLLRHFTVYSFSPSHVWHICFVQSQVRHFLSLSALFPNIGDVQFSICYLYALYWNFCF